MSKKKPDYVEKQCQFNCRTGRTWFFLGCRLMATYKVPREILEEYYQEEIRRMNDRQSIIGKPLPETDEFKDQSPGFRDRE